jgi:hypothetical protein
VTRRGLAARRSELDCRLRVLVPIDTATGEPLPE